MKRGLIFLDQMIDVLDRTRDGETAYIDTLRRVGKSKACAALTHYNIAVLVLNERHKEILLDYGARESLVFVHTDQLIGRAHISAIIMDEGYHRQELYYDMDTLRDMFNCPIIVIGTTRSTELLYMEELGW